MSTVETPILAPAPARGPSRFWPHCAMVCWGIVFLAVCGRTLLLKHDAHSVYPVFTAAAHSWLRAAPLYVRGGREEFRYSPLVAAFFVPFHLMPERIGHFLWRSLNLLGFLAGLLACWRAAIPRRFSANTEGAMFLLLIPLAVGSLNNAQSNPLVIGLLLYAIAAVYRRHWWGSAVAVTVATLFKLYPLSLGMLLVTLYPRQLGWRLAVCLGVGLLLPFALQRPGYVSHQYQAWAHYLMTEDRQRGPMSDWYKDARAVWRIYVGSTRAGAYQCVEVASGALLAAAVLRARQAGWPTGMLLAYTLSLACCWMTALGPATESTTYILIAPGAVWPLLCAEDAGFPGALRIGYGVAYGLQAVAAMMVWFGAAGKISRDQLQLQPLAGLLLLALLLIDGARRSWIERHWIPSDAAVLAAAGLVPSPGTPGEG